MHTARETVQEKEAPPATQVQHCSECGAPIITEPVLECARCGKVIRLRCFVYRASDCYVAECIDLDISSEGSTETEAIGGLQDAMRGYLHVAFDGKSTEGLILRPAPLSHRFRYHFEQLKDGLYSVFSKRRKRTVEQFYSVQYHSHWC